MRSQTDQKILVVAAGKKDTEPMLRPIRAAGHRATLVEDLEGAREALASEGFDRALLPASVLASLLEQCALEQGAESACRQSVAGVAHDLRRILNGLDRSIDEYQCEDAARGTGNLAEIRCRVSDLSTFLDELTVEISNWREGMHLSAIDLEDALEEAAMTVYQAALDKDLRLVIDIADEITHIPADRTSLRRALADVLDYAVRNTPPMGTVTARARREEGRCIISISNSGEGGHQAELPNLFRSALEPDGAGGASLSRAKRLIEQHGGRAWVETQSGRGSSITVSLPIARTVCGEMSDSGPQEKNWM